MPDTPPIQPTSLMKEPEIHVIPEQFYGVAGKAKLKSSKPAKAPAPATAPVSTTPPPGAMKATMEAQQTITKPKPASKKWMLIPVLALIFLIGLGVGTWFLLKPAAPAEAPTKPTTSIQPSQPQPTPEPEPEPEPEPTPEPEPEPEPTPEPEPEPEPLPSDDKDEDGLTMAEEALYGTSEESADSDKDGFADFLEVVNLYNPAGFTPTRLEDAGLVETYTHEGEHGFELLYPDTWTAEVQDDGSIIITDGEGESIAVEIVLNQEGQTLLDWFINEYPLTPTTQIEESSTKSGEAFLTTPSGNASFVFGDGVIYAISLEGDDAALKFMATYRMIVNSFTLSP